VPFSQGFGTTPFGVVNFTEKGLQDEPSIIIPRWDTETT
jgi:hypothetical protein